MSGTRRRNSKREQFWREMVAAWQKSGQSIRGFCLARGLSEASFFGWRRTLAERDGPRSSGRLPETEAAQRATVPPTLVPVRVVPSAIVEVVLPTGLVVRVPAGIEVAAVATLVAALVAAVRTPPC
jgi:transposase-like protein